MMIILIINIIVCNEENDQFLVLIYQALRQNKTRYQYSSLLCQ